MINHGVVIMATNGYIVANITQEEIPSFKQQINTYIEAFKKEGVNIKLANNLNALDLLKKEEHVDFVLFLDKDIALIYLIMNLGIKVFNSVDAIRMCDDKAYTYAQFIKNKINTPKTIVMPLTFFNKLTNYFERIKQLIEINNIKYPFIVKERRSSLGLGVYLVHNENEFKKILEDKWQRELIVQEYIDYEIGKDYRVFLINHRPKIVVTRINKNDFRSNVEQGGKMSLIKDPDENLLRIAIKASLAVQLDFGAVDIVKDEHNYYVLEVNSNARTMNLDKLSSNNISKQVVKYILENI